MEHIYSDFSKEETDVMEKLGFENGLYIVENLRKHTEKPNCCISCGEEFSDKNVFTKAGWKETKISGYCEKCWDKLFS